MIVVVSANSEGLDAQVSPVFGRCPVFTFVDTETMNATSLSNPAVSAGGGAGIQAAQLVVDEGAQAVLTGNVGPNAMQVLQAANIPVYPVAASTVRDAVNSLINGNLTPATAPTAPAHAGALGPGPAVSPGLGSGAGRGAGMGRGGGGGTGAGRGAGAGRGGGGRGR